MQVPNGPYYKLLESFLPEPSEVYARHIENQAKETKNLINQLIGKRRFRLGATVQEVTKEAQWEVYSNSHLPDLYREYIDCVKDDALRRVYEEKYLDLLYTILQVSPSESKPQYRDEVWSLAKGLVAIGAPIELAWMIHLDWMDYFDLNEAVHSFNIIEFSSIFPNHWLTLLLQALKQSDVLDIWATVYGESSNTNGYLATGVSSGNLEGSFNTHKASLDDLVSLLTPKILNLPHPIISRIAAVCHLLLEEYDSAIIYVQQTNDMLTRLQRSTDIKIAKSRVNTDFLTATTQIFYEVPRHQGNAKDTLTRLVSEQPHYRPPRISLALLNLEMGDDDECAEQCRNILSDNATSLAALTIYAKCLIRRKEFLAGDEQLDIALRLLEKAVFDGNRYKAEIYWLKGHSIWLNDEIVDKSSAYEFFATSLKFNPNYANNYTSLGLFYKHFARQLDRASRCFQKAFELEPTQIDSARELAIQYADSRQWDVVEAIASRSILAESSNIKQRYSWPYRTLGMAEIMRKEYRRAISHFQTALRISPMDGQCWLGLGEAYSGSGRGKAAEKAFERAFQLDKSIWHAQFLLADLKRQNKEYSEAATILQNINQKERAEFAIMALLLQVLVEWTSADINRGYIGFAMNHLKHAADISIALLKMESSSTITLQAVGDLCDLYSKFDAPSFDLELLKAALKGIIYDPEDSLLPNHAFLSEEYPDLDCWNSLEPLTGLECMHAVRLISVTKIHRGRLATGSAWYQLGISYKNLSFFCEELKNEFRTSSVNCFKRALQSDSRNPQFWNALGVLNSTLSPRASEIAFGRSLHLNPKDADTWRNLSVLYQMHGKTDLQASAFSQSQSIEPNLALTWLLRSYIAISSGVSNTDSFELLKHTLETFGPFHHVLLALLSLVSWRQCIAEDNAVSGSILNNARYLIEKISKRNLTSPILLLLAQLDELLGDLIKQASTLEKISEQLEAEYENSEDEATLQFYKVTQALLARTYCLNGNFEAATSYSEAVINLTENAERSPVDIIHLSAKAILAISLSFQNDFDGAIKAMEEVVDQSPPAWQLTSLLAKLCWHSPNPLQKEKSMKVLQSWYVDMSKCLNVANA